MNSVSENFTTPKCSSSQCRRQSIQSRGPKSKSRGAKFFIDFSPKKACRA